MNRKVALGVVQKWPGFALPTGRLYGDKRNARVLLFSVVIIYIICLVVVLLILLPFSFGC